MNFQLVTDEENENGTQRGKNETCRMITFVSRTRKHVRDSSADDRANDAQHDRPEDRHVRVHNRLRNYSRN